MAVINSIGRTGLVLLVISSNAFAALINFDDRSAGDPVTTIGNVTFSSDTGFGLIATDEFDTTSGENSLGVDASQLLGDSFIGGETVTLTFAIPVTSVSASFIAAPDAPGSAFSISTSSGSTIADANFDFSLPDGGEVYLLIFSSATAFSSADLVSFDLDSYTFNIDDIEVTEVPIPSVFLLFVSAIGILVAHRYTPASPPTLLHGVT